MNILWVKSFNSKGFDRFLAGIFMQVKELEFQSRVLDLVD